MNNEITDGRCPPKVQRFIGRPGATAMGVAAVILCCALPSLIAGGVLVAAAGWECGVWAAIAVAAAMGTLRFRRRHQRTVPLTNDSTNRPAANSDSVQAAHVKVAQ